MWLALCIPYRVPLRHSLTSPVFEQLSFKNSLPSQILFILLHYANTEKFISGCGFADLRIADRGKRRGSNGNIIGEHLGKRAVVLLAAKTLIENNYSLPDVDKYNRAFFYNEQEFEDRHNQGLMSDDAYNNRYTMIETKQGKFAICNQWGSGNWAFVEDDLLEYGNKRFELLHE